MNAWLIYSKTDAEYNNWYIEMHIEEGKKLGIHFQVIYTDYLKIGVCLDICCLFYKDEMIEHPDFVICRTIYPLLSKQLEAMNIKVFNNSHVAEICNDKAKTYQYLAGKGIPMVPTFFYQNKDLETCLSDENKDKVWKAVDGHGGKQVFLYKENRQEIIEGIGKSDFVLQPLSGNGKQDVRVYVIGKNVIAAICRTSKEGFRSNFSLGGEVCVYSLGESELKIVQRIINEFQFGLVGIDFLIGLNGEFIFNEIEDVVGARMLYQCTDINLVKEYLTFIIAQMNDMG